MKFLPIVNVYDPVIDSALRSGQLKLQTGQWIKCGDSVNNSRFICMKKNSIWVVHPNGVGKIKRKRFVSAINSWKS